MKPAYPKHRKVRSISRDARLLNIHLWTLADDEGRLQELLQWIIGEVFPTDEDVTPGVLREWLRELSEKGLILRYEVDGEHYIYCHDFLDHQKISHPTPSILPAPPAELVVVPEDFPNDSGATPEPLRPEVEEEVEGNREEEVEAAPADFAPIIGRLDAVSFARQISQPKVDASVKVCQDFADRDLSGEVEKFAHYWTEGPGEKRPLTDVAWAWRGWLGRTDAPSEKRPASGSARDTVSDDLKRLEAEHAAALAEEARA